MEVVNSELREIAMKSGNGETRVRGVERFVSFLYELLFLVERLKPLYLYSRIFMFIYNYKMYLYSKTSLFLVNPHR